MAEHWAATLDQLLSEAGAMLTFNPPDEHLRQCWDVAVKKVREQHACIKELEEELEGQEASAELHANLNRRAAKALGKPSEGTGSSWHDIPECIEGLRAHIGVLEGSNPLYLTRRELDCLDQLIGYVTELTGDLEEAIQGRRDRAAVRSMLRKVRAALAGEVAKDA